MQTSPLEPRFVCLLATSKSLVGRWSGRLKKEFFNELPHQDIVELIFSHYAEHRTVPTTEILQMQLDLMLQKEEHKPKRQMQGRYTILLRMIQEFHASDDDQKFLAHELQKWVQGQAFKLQVLESLDGIDSGDYDYLTAARKIRDAVNISVETARADFNFFNQLQGRTWPEHGGNMPTGFPTLDGILGGGLSPGELMIIASGPKRGKTSLLINLAVGGMQRIPKAGQPGTKTVFYTLELAGWKIVDRFEARISGVAKRDLRTRRDEVEQKCGMFHKLQKSELIVSDLTGRVTPDTIAAHLDELDTTQDFRPDNVVVDYLALMASTKSHDQTRLEIASIARDMRMLAREKQFRCYTANQTNRAAEDKETLSMDDLAECFELNAIADIVMMVCRTKGERELNQGRLFTAAVRDEQGEQVIPIGFDLDHAFMFEIDPAHALIQQTPF